VIRSWIAVPASGVACAAIALLSRTPGEAIAVGLAAAAIAAAVRAFAGASGAATAAAVIGALLGGLALLEVPGELVRAPLACAAAAFAIAELVRPAPPTASPWPAIGAAVVAGVLDPSFVVLVAVAGWKLMNSPWARLRYAPAVPVAGVLGGALAIVAALQGWHLWTLWAGHASRALDVWRTAAIHGDALGPIAAVAAVAGLAIAATRGRYAIASILGVFVASAAVALRTNTLGAAALMCGAVAAGVAIARLATLVRWPAGQIVVGALAGLLTVAAPALVVSTNWG
jgi:hypothetical protein